MLFAYSSYLFADGVQMSGIVSVLFCGIVMAHYTFNNLSAKAREFTREMFDTMASIAETFVFAYLGMAVFSFRQMWDFKLIAITLLVMLVARAANVFPISFLVNLTRREKKFKIPVKHQVMLWFAGLRGAMAFALVLNLPIPAGRLMLTTTLVMCIFTVIFFGGLSGKMLQLLDIDMHLDPRLASDEDEGNRDENSANFFLRVDRRYLKPFFTRLRPRTRVDEQPDDRDVDEMELVAWRTSSGEGGGGGGKKNGTDSATASTEAETEPESSGSREVSADARTAVYESSSSSSAAN
jgi:hypothetical protein